MPAFVKKEVLDTPRPGINRDRQSEHMAFLRGGEEWERIVERILPKHPEESQEVYDVRKKYAYYVNYAGAIISYFAAWVFTQQPEIRSDPQRLDNFWSTFRDDADTLGTSLHVMLRDRFVRALTVKRSWLLVDFPQDDFVQPAVSKDDWNERELGRAYCVPFDDHEVLDWEMDPRGNLEAATVFQRDSRRKDFTAARGSVTDTWTVFTRDRWERYERTYDSKQPLKPEDLIPLVAEGPSPTPGMVPLVRIELPDELFMMEHLFLVAREQCRQSNALSWSLVRTSYAVRNFFLESTPTTKPVHGPGFGNVYGVNERVEWDAPPATAFAPTAEWARQLKDEIYRVAHAMVLSIENNAAAIGRSADSKAADADVTVILVRAIAEQVRKVVKQLHLLVARGRNEQIDFTVGGMVRYEPLDPMVLTGAARTAQEIGIPSPTFHRILKKRVAGVLVPDASSSERDAIASEIDRNVTDESVAEETAAARGVMPEDERAAPAGTSNGRPARPAAQA